MDEFLTARQVQEMLKIDRITVYRMLNDGRIKGIKVGNQWRFSQREIERLLGDLPDDREEEAPPADLSDFPTDCVERLQEIFAGILGVGAITVNIKGEPITSPFFSNPFCQLMLSRESSRQACRESWRKIALRTSGNPNFHVCHAGLCYMRSPIKMGEETVAWMVTGQFYTSVHASERSRELHQVVAQKHHFDLQELEEAARKIPVLKYSQQMQVQEWAPKVSATVQSMVCERSDLVSRLERIAEISAVRSSLPKKLEK